MSKTSRELTIPNKSATWVETIYQHSTVKWADVSHPEPHRYSVFFIKVLYSEVFHPDVGTITWKTP